MYLTTRNAGSPKNLCGSRPIWRLADEKVKDKLYPDDKYAIKCLELQETRVYRGSNVQ
jgi:hypothetical protein